jgi:hypothetical protein
VPEGAVIGLVVLTYAPPAGMFEDCIAALRANTTTADGEQLLLVVVDNGDVLGRLPASVLESTDHLRVDRLAPGVNTGFAGGMNLGIRHAIDGGARAVVILNDDALVEPGWLPPLLGELDHPTIARVGAVQPKLLFTGEPVRINSLGVQLGPDGAGTDIALGDPDHDHPQLEPSDLAIFTGGAVLLSSEFVRATGGFDERYFLYYEDVDLALRGAELGWRYRLVPASRVTHRGSATASTIGDRAAFFRERNRLWVLFRHRPWRDVATGLWLSVRRLRWAPRTAHGKALLTGLAAAPRLIRARRAAPHRL